MKDYHIMRKICRLLFLVGGGNTWYEEETIGNDKTMYYRVYCILLIAAYISTIVVEIMATTLETLTQYEFFSAVSHGVVHTFFLLKILASIVKRESIKHLLYKLTYVCESIEVEEVALKKWARIKFVMGAYVTAIYGATVMYIVRGVIDVFQGQYFYMFVTYYAPPGDNSPEATYFRVALMLTVSMFLTTATVVDALVITIMLIYKYKFVLLKKYFEQLGKELAESVSRGHNNDIASAKLYKGLREGVTIHISIVRLIKELDESLGILTAMQLFCTSFPAVFQLLMAVTSMYIHVSDSTDVLDTIKVLFFICTVFLLLGIYLCTIGDITEEASTLSDSIFYCGWHLCPATSPAFRKIRVLITISIAQAQQPINMKALKMVHLTHACYIKVIKSTYSVYALLRAQN